VSQENVEILRAFLDTWEPREWARGEGMSIFDPEVVYEADFLPDQTGPYRGHEGLARATRTWLEPFQKDGTVKLERIIGTGDCLVSVQRARGTMRHTGIEVEITYAYLWKFRDGKAIYLKTFGDPLEALKAAGMEE
jgi:ketosteroid isomerase-like protein